MWFLFGFFTLAGFIAYSIHHRRSANWKGLPSQVKKKRYEYEVITRKDTYGSDSKPIGLRVGITSPQNYDFSLRPEKWRDWVAKHIGFSVEMQTGDSQFDRAVYVLSNDQRIGLTLSENAELRADILKIFRTVTPRSATLKEIRCSNGRLWIHYKLKDGLSGSRLPLLAEHVVPGLYRLASSLATRATQGVTHKFDPFVWRAVLLLAVSSGLAINGFAHLVRLILMPIPFTVESSTLIYWSLLLGGIVVAILSLTVIFWLGRSARAHVVLFEILLVGSLGAVTTSFVELRDLNMEWDKREPVRYEVTVLSSRVSRGRRSTSYYITFKGWPTGLSSNEIKVPSSLYNQSSPGMKYKLLEKPGYLNVPWVAGFET